MARTDRKRQPAGPGIDLAGKKPISAGSILLLTTSLLGVLWAGSLLTEQGRVAYAYTFFFVEFFGGVLALVGLTLTVMIGLLATDRLILHPRQRVWIQAAHRSLGIFSVAWLAIHILTKVSEGRASVIGSAIPFLGTAVLGQSTVYVGLGQVAGYLMVGVLWTGIARRRFVGVGKPWMWRALHSVAYLSWPIALLHGLGAGRPPAAWVTLSYLACVLGVAVALLIRLSRGSGRRKQEGRLATTTMSTSGSSMRPVGRMASGAARRSAALATVEREPASGDTAFAVQPLETTDAERRPVGRELERVAVSAPNRAGADARFGAARYDPPPSPRLSEREAAPDDRPAVVRRGRAEGPSQDADVDRKRPSRTERRRAERLAIEERYHEDGTITDERSDGYADQRPAQSERRRAERRAEEADVGWERPSRAERRRAERATPARERFLDDETYGYADERSQPGRRRREEHARDERSSRPPAAPPAEASRYTRDERSSRPPAAPPAEASRYTRDERSSRPPAAPPAEASRYTRDERSSRERGFDERTFDERTVDERRTRDERRTEQQSRYRATAPAPPYIPARPRSDDLLIGDFDPLPADDTPTLIDLASRRAIRDAVRDRDAAREGNASFRRAKRRGGADKDDADEAYWGYLRGEAQ